MLDVTELLEQAERYRICHLFGQSPEASWTPETAYVAALQEQLKHRITDSAASDLVRLGDLIVAAYSLDAGPTSLKALAPAESAASLYASAGYSSRTRVLRRNFTSSVGLHSATGGDQVSLLLALAHAVYVAISVRNIEVLPELRQRITPLSERKALSLDYRRCAALLAHICEEVTAVVTSGQAGDSQRRLISMLDLFAYVAAESRNAPMLDLAKNVRDTTLILLERSTNRILRSAQFRFTEGYLKTLLQPDRGRAIVELWPSQIAAINAGAIESAAFVISLPTSAGKTLLAELKTVEFLTRRPNALAVYIAPYIALASQVGVTLERRLLAAGLNPPQIWTGAFEIDDTALSDANLLIMTPEKFDSVLRNRKDGDDRASSIFDRLGLVVVDEAHMIGTPGRGLSLELFLARLLKLKRPRVEILAMSAVLKNTTSLAEWLSGRTSDSVTNDWRPTDRQIFYLRKTGELLALPGLKATGISTHSWKTPKEAVAKLCRTFVVSGAAPVLVIETQRRYAESAVEAIANDVPQQECDSETQAAREAVVALVDRFLGKNHPLHGWLLEGFAFHHAGLPREIAVGIEDLARHGYLRVVCATTTLAEGIDLPFRSVIIPHVYLADKSLMSTALVQNIIGRAGRAEVSINGTAVILEPGTARPAKFAENTLLKSISERQVVRSNIETFSTDPKTHQEWDHYLRAQSQLTGLLLDETFEDDQATLYAEATFGVSAKQVSAPKLQRAFTAILDNFVTTDPPLAVRSSPYRLTDYGRVASIGGLSASSNKLMLRELHGVPTWFSKTSWLARDFDSELMRTAARLIHMPLEALTLCLDRWQPNFNSITREWIRNKRDAWEAELAPHVTLLYSWLLGEPMEQMAHNYNEARGIRAQRARAKRYDPPDVLEIINQRLPSHLWHCSAIVRLSEMLDTTGVNNEIPFRRILPYLEYGTSSGDALEIMLLGCDRGLAHKLIPLVREMDRTDEDAFHFSLLSISESILKGLGLSREQIALYADFKKKIRGG